ncbi:MAG: hypothetical protein CVU38_05440 [Chloroflexi bacterium HGW-Chloroflexi-1]|nr:MAG: hypothetical protein CVU38_05440 [Chloroflexi bacterium HGW-Chloroflexi-1]
MTMIMKRSRRDVTLSIFLLLVILALAAGVRFYRIDAQSLWSDEGNSAVMAARSLPQIARDAANDIHPPLYYWLLRLWTRVAGMGEFGLRSLSALLGVALVWAVAELGRRLYNDTTGLATAFVAALAPFQVYYSQEARMYILLTLLATTGVLALWWFVELERRELSGNRRPTPYNCPVLTWPALGLALSWIAGLYTHYAFPLVIGVLTVLYLAWLWSSRALGKVGRRLLRWTALLTLASVFFAPWLPIALRQITTWPSGGSTMSTGAALQTALAVLGLGSVARDGAGSGWMWALTALALLGVLPLPLHRARVRAAGAPGNLLRWLTPVVWVAAPLASMLAFGLFRDAYLKFLLVASPAYCLLLARGILAPAGGLQTPATRPPTPATPPQEPWFRSQQASALGRGAIAALWVVLTLALVGGLSGAALSRYFTAPAVARDDYRGITQFIAATAHPNDAILLDAPGQIEVFSYYYRGDLPVYALPRHRPLDPEDTLGQLRKLLDYDKVYALYWASEEADPGRLIANWMDSWGYKTLDQWHGNVRLAVCVMPERRAPDEIVDNLDLRLGPAITLLGYRGWNLTLSAGQVTQVQLLWRADGQPASRYKVFLQLLDQRDQVIAQRDSEPVGDSRPTDGWEPGEVIPDNHGLLIPPGTPPGTYRRIIGMYDANTLERLRLPDDQDFIDLPPITVLRAKTPPLLAAFNMGYSQSFDFGGITLLGHDRYKRGFGHAPDTPLYPGDRLHLTFYWRANVEPRADWWFDLALSDATGETVADLQAPLVADTYSTPLWEQGEIVRGEHDLSIPAELPPGAYRLSLILLPDTDTPAGAAYLGTVKVTRGVDK